MKTPQEFTQAYSVAVRNKKIDDFVGLYDESILIFDLWDDWRMKGLQACRDMAEEWFASLKDEYVQTTFSDVKVVENSDLAFITCFVRFAGHSSEGKELRFLDERMTVTLRRDPSGAWKVIHQHTSSPVDSQKMTAKLKQV